jgi:hypothetical protein
MLATVEDTVGAAGVAAASERTYSTRSVSIQNAVELSSRWGHIRPSLLTHVTFDGITQSTVMSNACQNCGHLQLGGPSLLQLRGGGEDVEEDEEEDEGDVGEEDGDTVQDELEEEENEEKGESEDTSPIDTEESCVKGRRKGRGGAKTEKEIRAILLEHLRDLQESVGVKGRFVKDRVDPAAAKTEAAAAEEAEAAALLYARTVVAGDACNKSQVSASFLLLTKCEISHSSLRY